MEGTPQLNPSDLYDKRRIYNRIRTISKLPNSQCYLLYTIPPFILGLPKIDLEDCVVYIVYQLRHAGYEVRYSPPNMVYISWLHHEKSYLVEQSPIMQAMLESAEKTAAEIERKEKDAARLLGPGKRTQRKVIKQMPGLLQSISSPISRPSHNAINTVLNRPLSNPTAGPPPPAANDYVPPATFLQNMNNPQNETTYPKSVPDYFKR
jgi:hypothetical protein